MRPDRNNTKIVLIDIRYSKSMNEFEEYYGNCITYQELEQESYIELKNMMFDLISNSIKFRKHERIGNTLTVKAYMLETEVDDFNKLIALERLAFLHEWTINKIVVIKDPENFE